MALAGRAAENLARSAVLPDGTTTARRRRARASAGVRTP